MGCHQAKNRPYIGEAVENIKITQNNCIANSYKILEEHDLKINIPLQGESAIDARALDIENSMCSGSVAMNSIYYHYKNKDNYSNFYISELCIKAPSIYQYASPINFDLYKNSTPVSYKSEKNAYKTKSQTNFKQKYIIHYNAYFSDAIFYEESNKKDCNSKYYYSSTQNQTIDYKYLNADHMYTEEEGTLYLPYTSPSNHLNLQYYQYVLTFMLKTNNNNNNDEYPEVY